MCIIHVCQVQHKKISLSSPSSHLSDSLLQTESCPHSFISPRLFVWKTPSSGPQSERFRSPALRYIKRRISFAPLHQSPDPSCGDRSSLVFISWRRRREIREGDLTLLGNCLFCFIKVQCVSSWGNWRRQRTGRREFGSRCQRLHQ